MAFTPAPVAGFFGSGYNATGNTIVLNTAAGSPALLAQLTNAEASNTTGDWREVVFALMEMLFTKYDALADADKPLKVVVTKYANISSADVIVHNYNVQVTSEVVTQDVASE